MPADLSWASNVWVWVVSFRRVTDSKPEVKHRPILFSGAMVRAILGGQKTQTRRAVRLPRYPTRWPWEPTTTGGPTGGELHYPGSGLFAPLRVALWNTRTGAHVWCPFDTGDRLWVRERWARWSDIKSRECIVYAAGGDPRSVLAEDAGEGDPVALGGVAFPAAGEIPRWRPSIHMPRWASRLTLEVVSVRVERLQEISEEDARAEGIQSSKVNGPTFWLGPERSLHASARLAFAALWDSINGARKAAPGRAA